MRKDTHPLIQLLVLLFLMLAMLLVTGMFTFIIGLVNGSAGMALDSTSKLLWVQSITQVMTFIVPVLLIGLIYYKGGQQQFFRLYFGGSKWLLWLAGIVVMLLLTPLNEWLTEWNAQWNLGQLGETMHRLQEQTEGIMEKMLETTTVGGLLANLVVVALIPAVSEELFFRGGIQNILQKWLKNPHIVVWLTAVIFSLGHGEIFSFMPRLVMGATLGYLYICSGSILPNMLAHFANNAIIVVLYWLNARGDLAIDPEAPIDFGWILTACCTLAAIVLFIVTFVKKQKTSE